MSAATRRASACAAALTALLGGCAGDNADRPWVRSVVFDGARHIRARDLRGRLAVRATGWWPFARKQRLDPFSLQLDKKRIEAYYQTQGYYGARVDSVQVEPAADQSVRVRFRIEEGLPTRVSSVQVSGLSPLGKPGQALERRFLSKLPVGQIFYHGDYLAARDQVAARLKLRGHAWSDVSGQVDLNRDVRTADVRLAVTPNPVATLGDVRVRGSRAVAASKIALHAGLRRGDRFNPRDLETARGKLYNLGLFSSVGIEYLHNPQRPEVADILIDVREGKLRELRLGLGLALEPQRNDVHAEAVYTQRNFLGGLRSMTARLRPGYVFIPAFWDVYRHGPSISIEAEFVQPDVFWAFSDLKWSVGYDVGIDYAYQFHGPRTQIGVSSPFWRDRLRVGVSYNFQFLSFFATDPAILENPSQAGVLYGYQDPYRLGYWQQDLAIDLRDRPVDPRRGGYLALNAEESGVYSGSRFDYQKILPELRGYLPLGGRVVLAGRLMYGQIFTQGELGSPITRRFYLGGPNSHRGFSYNRLSVQVPSCPYQWHYEPALPVSLGGPPLPVFTVDRCVPNHGGPGGPDVARLPGGPNHDPYARSLDPTLLPIGGDQMLLVQAEVRVQLLRLFGTWLSAAVFLDGGDVAAPSAMLPASLQRGLDLSALHWATGAGLRYQTLVGTLRADLGVRLNRLEALEIGVPNAGGGPPAELRFRQNPDPGQRFAFHISIGEAF